MGSARCPVCREPLSAVISSSDAPPLCTVCQGQPWYYAAGGQPSGPMAWQELSSLAAAGRLRPDDKVCRQGMSQWQLACEIGGLFAKAPAERAWYHAKGGQPSGPLSWEQLRALAVTGQLRPDDKVCRYGMSQWQLARETDGLFAAPETVAPATPQPVEQPSSGVTPRPKPLIGRWYGPALVAGLVAAGLVVLGVAFFGTKPPPPPPPTPAAELAWQFEYDDNGDLTRKVDPAGRETRIRSEKDDKGRIVKRRMDRPDGSQMVVEFDRFGHPVTVAHPSGTIRRKFDPSGRLREVQRDGAPVLAYEYDEADRVAAIRIGDSRVLGYRYDFRGRLRRIDTAAGSIEYQYPPRNNQVQRKLPNGVQTVWRYLPSGALAFLEHAGPDGKVLVRFEYAYRPDGLLREVQEITAEGKRTLAYDYDNLGQLTAATDSRQGKYTYRYDAFANRTEVVGPDGKSVISAYDWAGRLTQHDSQLCSHDGAGNLTGYSRGDKEVSLEHNGDNQLVSAQTSAAKVRYVYDGEGRLVARTSGGRTVAYVPDPMANTWKPLRETAEDGKQLSYVWERDKPLAALAGTASQFFLENHQGSICCVVDAAGKVVERRDYDPFGAPRQTKSGSFRPGFAGMFYDAEVGLYLTAYRVYDPALGRFLQADPIHRVPRGSQKDLSLYAYCGADPINYTDRDGAQSLVIPTQGLGDLRSWTGTPYQYGGKTSEGIDCSNLMARNIQNTINPAFENPGAQNFDNPNFFTPVKWANRAPGDFIQFAPHPPITTPSGNVYPANSWHVGRLNDVNSFIGAQSSTGVAEVNFAKNPYWNQRANENYAQILRYTGPSVFNYSNSTAPTNVGGVKLRGIGNALKDLGPLKGIAVDANGRLVLLTAEQGDVKLPPLRIDDVVTIFRAAYRQGEAPYVSIDPDKKDAHGPTMDIRHSPGTEDTFVGWVLFETDRVMKAFSLGKDNLTGERIQTAILGYHPVPDLLWDDPPRDEKNKLWTRYWIVPAAVKRHKAKRHQLTLLDVPLKVDTEPVVPKEGKLESVPGAKSDPSSETFARWFGDHINDLAREVWSAPPTESGWTEKVPVFAELQRIALIAAMAEQLRDQNVPMPAWMREYSVPPFRMPRTTPTMTGVSRRKAGTRSVFGGAQMSPPRERVIEVDSPEAEVLAPHVLSAVAKAPSLTPIRFQHEGKTYQAVALPGEDTQALGACRLEETDLSLPLPGENTLRLVRAFNSFHQPTDVFGGAWTLDLPRLEVQYRRLPSQGKVVPLRRVYQLTSPLGSWCESFLKEEQVAGGPSFPIAVPNKPGDMLGVWKEKDGPNVLLFPDGRRWHFDDEGYLVEKKELPLRVVYQRDGQHRVQRIEGRYGQALRVHIDLRYDEKGRLVEAVGSEGGSVRYKYDAAGLLSEVQRPGEVLAYRYQDGRVQEILRNGARVKRFEYNPQGEILSESRGEGEKLVFEVANVSEGVQITTASADQPGEKEQVVYDTAYRPLRVLRADGGRLEYRYEESGAVSLTVQPPQSEPLTIRRSADRREETWQIAGGSQATFRYATPGRLQEVVQDGRRILHQEWGPGGLPRQIVAGGVAYQPAFDGDHIPTWLLIQPERTPDASSKEFVQVRYNDRGIPALIREDGGATVTLDSSGNVLEWSPYEDPRTKEKKDWMKFRRDDQGRVRTVETTWGRREQADLEPDGSLRKLEVTEGDKQARAEFSKGRLTRLQKFDGSVVNLAYGDAGPGKDKVREVRLPNDVVLTYAYDDQGRLAAVVCNGVYRFVYLYDAKGRLTAIKQTPCAG